MSLKVYKSLLKGLNLALQIRSDGSKMVKPNRLIEKLIMSSKENDICLHICVETFLSVMFYFDLYIYKSIKFTFIARKGASGKRQAGQVGELMVLAL